MRCFMYGSLWISIISMILCIGCSKNKTKESPKGPPPIAVRVATVERVTVPLEIKSNGRVSSPQKITIIPQVSGELIKVYVKEGDILNKGQEIFTIDSRTYKANYQASQAKLNKVKVQLDLAKKNYGRFKILKQKNYISDQELENKLTDIEVALSNMQSAQAELETSRIKLEYCQIKSPIEGKIGRILIQEGNFIRGGDSGSKLAEINVLDPIDVIFNITEDEFAEFRNLILSTKIPIYAELPGKSKGELKGDLIFIDNQVDTATGTLLLKGSFSNKALKIPL